MIKYGFEKEYFLWKRGVLSLLPLNTFLPHDECGYLVETRGEPHSDPLKAAFLLLAEEHRLSKNVRAEGFVLGKEPFQIITKEFERQAFRTYGKNVMPCERGNMLGLDFPIETEIVARAGLHIHFSNTISVKDKDGKEISTCSGMLDMCKIIQLLDKKFETEIQTARRIPGCYEMKPHGFEYRSLPCNVDVIRVAEAIRGF